MPINGSDRPNVRWSSLSVDRRLRQRQSSRLKSPSVSARQIPVSSNDSEIFLLTSDLYIHCHESCQAARGDSRADKTRVEVKASVVMGQTIRLPPGPDVVDVVDRRDAGRSRQRRRGLTDSQLGCIDGFPASPVLLLSSVLALIAPAVEALWHLLLTCTLTPPGTERDKTNAVGG